jgi:hypothetical protein
MRPSLIGGVALGVSMGLVGLISALAPLLGCLGCVACCTLPPGAGFLASYLYLKDAAPAPEKPYGDGAVLGLMAGIFGAVVGTVVSIPIQFLQRSLGLMPDTDELIGQMQDANLPPEVVDLIEKLMPSAEGFSIVGLVFGFFVSLLVYAVLSLIGGVVGVAVLAKEGQAAGYAPPPPPA